MSKFTSTKKGLTCPICDDHTGKCRIIDTVTLCMNSPDGLIETSGYKYLHASKDGLWGIYVEDNGQTHSNDAKRVYKAQKVERDLITKHRHETSLNLIERDREYRKLINQLPHGDQVGDRTLADLTRRGLNAEQIERMLFASVGQWHPLRHAMTTQLSGVIGKGNKLNVMGDGYLVPIPNIDGLIVGSQYRVFEPIDGNKYPWLTSKTKNNPDGATPHLPNGELPMGVYRPQNLIKKGVVGLDEGYLKPSIAVDKVGHICLGMASGNFAACPEQFEQALKLIEVEQGIKPYLLLYPDAGAVQNPHVMDTYSRTYKLAVNLGYELKVEWHGQFSKTKHQDIDELDNIDDIKEISWYEFLGLQHKALKDETVTISQRYLTDLDIPDSAKLICLRSPKGTNKTGYIAKYVDGQRGRKRFLVICHRSQLTQQLGHRLGLRTHYELENATGDIKAAIIAEISLFGMVTTWDSLHKINPDDWKDCEIILDEAEQSIWHLLNSTTDIESRRVDTIAMLSQLLQECDRTWLLDADLTNTAIEFTLGQVNRRDFEPYIVLNNYLFEEPWDITIYADNEPARIQQALLNYLGIGKKCLLHLDSQKCKGRYSGVNIERMVNKLYPHLKTLLIDSHTVQNPDHPAYRILTDANICDRLSGYDLVIATPTIETGVSIDAKGLFDAVFGIFFGVVTADSARQALARYRQPVERHIWAKTYSPISGNPDYKQALTMQSKATRAHTRELQDADLGHIDVNPFPSALTTWAKMQARVRIDAMRFRGAIIDGLIADGHICHDAEAMDTLVIENLKEAMTANRDESYSEKCEAIAEQATIDDDRAKQISDSKSRTDEHEDQLRKWELSKSYGVEVTPELVQLDDQGLYKKLHLLYFLTDGKEYLKPRDKNKASSLMNSQGKVWQPTVNKKLLIGKIRKLVNLDVVKVLMNPDREYRDTDEDLNRFRKKAVKDRFEIKALFGITINPNAGAITIAKQVLGQLGLDLTYASRDRLPTGKAGCRVYKFLPIGDTDIRRQILQNWLKVDAQKLAKKSAEMIDTSNIEYDPPTVIINSITESGSNLAGSDVMAITPSIPNPNSKPSNKPTTPPQNAIQWQKGMSAMYEGCDWLIATLGTATAKIVRNGFELWVDLPDLAIA